MLQSILGIRSENFEHLIKELLVNIGYQNVEVTRAVRDDRVDVIAYKEGSGISNKIYKVIVQCKRYAKKPVDIDVAERLLEDMKRHQAKEGLLITTSTFSVRAKEFAQNHQYVSLIDREELQAHLDKAFGDNSYCIINRY
jgi:restriction system protein